MLGFVLERRLHSDQALPDLYLPKPALGEATLIIPNSAVLLMNSFQMLAAHYQSWTLPLAIILIVE